MEKIEFKDLPDTTTPLSADNLNDLQNNVEEAIDEVQNNLDVVNTYSTNEVVIGTFLGKPLYRKVIEFGALPNTTSKSVSTGYAATDIIVRNLYGTAVYSNGITIPLPNVSDVTGEIIKIVLNNGNIIITTNNDRSSATTDIIIEYTKTTD